jgi:hypothetical protein
MSRSPERARYDVIAERVGEILHYVWDPIGVSGVPQARDEYDSYVPLVAQMLMEGKKEEEIARHLHRVEGETMGLSAGASPSKQTEEAAAMLADHFQWLEEKANQAPDPTRSARGSS